MEFSLVSGRFTAKETEELLTKLVKVKTDFHNARIESAEHSEADIKHSEKRIKELEEQLQALLNKISEGGYEHVALRAKLSIEYVPDYQYA